MSMRFTRGAVLAVATASLLAAAAAEAAPLAVTPKGDVAMSPPTEQVAYRRRYYGYAPRYRYTRRYYNPAGAAIAGAALGIIGAGIAAAAAPRYEYYPAYGYGYRPYGYGYGYGYRPYGYGYYSW